MRDPYRSTSDDCRKQARDRSYELIRTKIASDIVSLMVEHGGNHKDLAVQLGITPEEMKRKIWEDDLSLSDINSIMDVFSYEMVPLFRRRWPVTQN